MKLTESTITWIQDFAEESIFKRGQDCVSWGNVNWLEYNSELGEIHASVTETDSNYEVTISESDHTLEADCTCSYDGYPCKHVVAVLLQFVDKKTTYCERAEEMAAQLSEAKKNCPNARTGNWSNSSLKPQSITLV